MRLIGLTGDIGAGKSTVAALLAQRGAVIVDADLVARQVVEPGMPALAQIVERFGADMVTADGRLDRVALASAVFNDDAARKDLEAITHPAIAVEMLRQVAEHRDRAPVVVMDIPLLREKARYGLDMMVVVTAPVEERVRRLLADRQMTEADARARIAAQAYLADRIARADVVLDNGGTRDELVRQVDDLWTRLTVGV